MCSLLTVGRSDRSVVVSPGHDRWDTVPIRPPLCLLEAAGGRIGHLPFSLRAVTVGPRCRGNDTPP
ncbi:hypothetical protein ELS17_14310 [Natrinema altunense]|uniref:Uncharacterized protein n=1 Tax=Natrinema altunense TaxID=222984 RepID=A0A482XYI9_9EURY|nr:hypothetical protein ELS17_14310 [Natrinema altunense]